MYVIKSNYMPCYVQSLTHGHPAMIEVTSDVKRARQFAEENSASAHELLNSIREMGDADWHITATEPADG
jgi:aminoglycoside N3'-acetyltransferase